MGAFVKSVEYVEITLTDAGPTSANLTKGQTIADCVPFYTVNLTSDVNADMDRWLVEVFFEAGPKVTAQRSGSGGTVVVGIFVVEFDTSGNISVEQGTWDLLSAEAATTEAISSVTTTKAFCLIAYRHNLASRNWDRAQVAVSFNSGTELSFDRGNTVGAVTGRYYVVSTTGTEFSVQHDSFAMGSTVETATNSISAVTLADTFVYGTWLSVAANTEVLDGGYVFDVQDTTTVRARRGFDSFGGSAGSANDGGTVETQVISAGANEFSVERNECDWADSLTKTVNITSIAQTKAIIVSGGYQGNMNSKETAITDFDGNYGVLKFNSDTQIIGTRASNTDPDGTIMFEVVEFVLLGEEPPESIEIAPMLSPTPRWDDRVRFY